MLCISFFIKGDNMDQQQFFEQLDTLFSTQQYQEIESFLLQSLKITRQQQDRFLELAILNEIVGYFRSLSRCKEAIIYGKEALKMIEQLQLNQSEHHATTLLNLATAYRENKEFDYAIRLYKEANMIFDQTIDKKDYRFAGLYNNMALAYLGNGEYDLAISQLKKALEIIENQEDCKAEEATTYTNLSNAYIEKENYPKAKEALFKALTIFKQDADHDAHYSGALSSLAHVYYLEENYEESLRYYTMAMDEIKRHFGENNAFYTVLMNLVQVLEKTNHQDQANILKEYASVVSFHLTKKRPHYTGLQLSKQYYFTYGKEMLKKKFPELYPRVAVGLVGLGSECLGYDDEISMDHDFGPAFCIWLNDDDYKKYGKKLQMAYDALPKDFQGYPRRNTSDQGKHRVGVLSISKFYQSFIGNLPKRQTDWFFYKESSLKTLTSGEIFEDNLQEFTNIKNQLSYYPEDVRIKKIVACMAYMSQSGQYNYARMMIRKDVVAANFALQEFIKYTIKLVYLLKKQYAPYYKWMYHGMPELKDIKTKIKQLVTTPLDISLYDKSMLHTLNQKDLHIVIIEDICHLIVDELKRQSLTDLDDPFLQAHLQTVSKHIQSKEIQQMHVMEGINE